jgi:Mn2+/Fe2+ NRAMP family transporter
MIAVQMICARIGIATGQGLASVLRDHYSRRLLWFATVLLLVANTINIGADLAGMAAALELMTGFPDHFGVLLFAGIMAPLLIFASYPVIARALKWLTLGLFAYIAAAFFARPHWAEVLRATVLPRIESGPDYLMTIVAILGTTISPYLFFWQANAEVEERRAAGIADAPPTDAAYRASRTDVIAGMSISQIIAFFVILTTGATLHQAGLHDIQTAAEAAKALEPLAGPWAEALFALGLIGTGLLGVPVLAGSAALAVAEASGWPSGLSEPFLAAKRFYSVMALSIVLGVVMAASQISAIKLLFWAAVVNGVLAPPLILIVLLVANNRKVMGDRVNGRSLNLLGGLAAAVMAIAALMMVVDAVR